jgi:hypothetical protein
MFGLNITVIDWVMWGIAILVSIYAAVAKNPHNKGTDEYQALRLYRIGGALLFWSFGLGLLGIAFALTSFILGIIVIIKGSAKNGIVLIIGSVVIPILGMTYTLSGLMK